MSTTLDHIRAELKMVQKAESGTTEAIERLEFSIDEFVRVLKLKFDSDKLNDTETKRERKAPSNNNGRNVFNGLKAGLGAGVGFGLIDKLTPSGLISLLLGGSLAGGGALAGMRGYEISLLKAFKDRISLGLGIGQDGKFITKLTNSGATLMTRIKDSVLALEKSIMKFFGMSFTGPMTRDALGKFTGASRVPLTERLINTFGKIMKPFMALIKGIDDYIVGPGAKMISFISKYSGLNAVASGIGKGASLFSKILWPVGVLISLFDGVKAFISKEGTMIEKFRAGLGGFLGDFIGAPLNLLKRVITWGIDKIFNTDISSAAKNFDFEKVINTLITSPMVLVNKVKNFVLDSMTQLDLTMFSRTALLDKAKDKIVQTYDTLLSSASSMLDVVSKGLNEFKTYLNDIPSRLKKIFKDNFSFSFPKIEIPLPFDKKWVITEGFNFNANADSIPKMVSRNKDTEQYMMAITNQSSTLLRSAQKRLQEMESNNQNGAVLYAPNQSNTNVNSSISNFSSYPSSQNNLLQ